VHGNGPSGHFLLESQLGKDIREDIARLAVNNDWGLIELKLISMTLEDVFLQLTHREEGFSLGSGEAAASGSPATLTSVDRMDPPS
jgi:ABC-2 type transport system ATP-binding protein